MSKFAPFIAVNGRLGANISPLDRGFTYGDGVFETMRVSARGVVLWELHRQRLEQACQHLKIPLDSDKLIRYRDALLTLAARQHVVQAVMKIIVSRGVGGRGYALPEHGLEPTICIGVFPLPEYPSHYWSMGVDTVLCNQRLGSSPQLAGLKHLNKLEHILARQEWQGEACAEGLLRDARGMVIEGTVTNIFIVSDRQLSTPKLNHCGVAGVMRRLVMERLAPALEMGVDETELSLERLYGAREVFLTNSVNGVWPVKSITDCAANFTQVYEPGEITRSLQRALEYYLAGYQGIECAKNRDGD